MPTYVYRCVDCRDVSETTCAATLRDAYEGPCPRCGSVEMMRRIVTAPSIQFNGAGFYRNDKAS